MFIIPSKYVPDVSPLFKCVESITKFHPTEKIIVVDSYSDDDSYLKDFEKYDNVIVSKYKNKHYECGALYYAYKEFPNEQFYALIQDSIILKTNWGEFIHDDITYNLMWFQEAGPFLEPQFNYLKEVLEKTDYLPHENTGHKGTYGMLGVYKKDVIETFINKGLLEVLLPIDKFGSQMTERIAGICLTQDGQDIVTNSIEGDFLSKVSQLNNHELKYFKKFYMGRQ